MDKSEIKFTSALHDYILSVSLREPDVLRRLREETDRDPNAIMQIPPEQGQLMAFLIRVLGAKKAIEIGTYTGYSTLCVALALPQDGVVVACDINDGWAEIGRKYWNEAGVADRIDFRLGPALDTMDELLASGQRETFDFAFIDADKSNYIRYYEATLSLLRPGGIIAIDNVLLFGSVVDPTVLDADLRSRISNDDISVLRELNEKIGKDPRVDLSMLPVADGLTLVRKR
ncbi:class I SAM-dependent methyltransferase [Chitinivorax sp. PXF-14]|uniref:class I SAM-dependent methyltransferase n=1 Tax=Chitinivorax sp. PXF-14 TaxID=3230488 RepID=UPI003466B965